MPAFRTLPIVIALPTALGLIAYAYAVRHWGRFDIPQPVFYLVAALIAMLPAGFGLARHRSCCARS